jgi:hypothetical protein
MNSMTRLTSDENPAANIVAQHMTAFGVPAQHNLHAAVLEHRHRDFARERAVVAVVEVLSAELHARAAIAKDRADHKQVWERREDRHFRTVQVGQTIDHAAREFQRGEAVGVHLPVAADVRLALAHVFSIGTMNARFPPLARRQAATCSTAVLINPSLPQPMADGKP